MTARYNPRKEHDVRDEARRKEKSFDFCWLVFDKDDYYDFDEAIAFALENGFKVSYSNHLWTDLTICSVLGGLGFAQYTHRFSNFFH